MSDVIDFLEKLGSDARLLQAAKDEVALALADAQVEAAASEAILARNVEELHALLKVAPSYCFQTVPRREDEDEEEKEGEEGEESEEQAKQPGNGAGHSSAHAADLA
ncbi:hypothetical protein [Dyella japonica]|uniref:CO dehydrogenase/acetyl-CoA synthase beta subunit n=1 Tax=Dyella japonica TaxID=231455 RepID=A0ABV2K0H7_9GAMM